jgi:quercetin dioxygenase-like cupin family protein
MTDADSSGDRAMKQPPAQPDLNPAAASPRQPTGPIAQGLPTKTFGDVRPEAIHWAPFAAFPPEARLAVLVGDPAKPGPYVVRVKVPAGVKLMPHIHPEDRIYTVISGVFYIGLGDDFDPSRLVAYEPGSVVVLPGNTPHFHWARSGEYVTQVSGFGPLGISYVDLHDDPRQDKSASLTSE